MKKLFISCPMNGRTTENILRSIDRMHKLAEIVFDQKLEVIPSYIPNIENASGDGRRPIWYLGESIKKMSEADYFVGIRYTNYFKGCNVETRVAEEYGIPCYFADIDVMMPDAVDLDRNYYQAMNTIPVKQEEYMHG